MADDTDPLEQAGELIAGGRAAEAARLLRERIDAGRGGTLARVMLVKALLAAGKNNAALAAAHEVATLNPAIPEAVLALGDVLVVNDSLAAAILEYYRVTRLDPANVEARLKLGLCWLDAGEPGRAEEQFAQLDPDAVPELAGLRARGEAMLARQRSDPGYVRHLFNQFSAQYERNMRGLLRYRAPEVLRELADLVMPGRHGLAILDLGCGTGLGAVAFADLKATMDGVDLSPEMILQARLKMDGGARLYRRLWTADFETVLGEGEGDYDLILAADSLVYIGDLAATFAGVARRLKPGGFFLFTVEKRDGDGFALGPKRRWHHSETYLRALAAETGLDVAGLVACTPRFEENAAVEGWAVALTRPV